ncbi:MAG: DUF6916 family protein [Thermoanaerobaculia bacterium]
MPESQENPGPIGLGELTIELAEPFVGKTFEVTAAGSESVGTMKLDAVLPYEIASRRRPRQGTAPKRKPFSLFFLGSPERILPQGRYTFRTDGLVLEEIFIVPISRDDEAAEYEAVFN